MLLLSLLACTAQKDDTGAPAAPPFGMILAEDGQIYAGVARVDLTPEIVETYTDVNGNNEFDGCMTDPTGTRGGCPEPYDDVDGDNHFDGVWIAGFQSRRAAVGVHDPITATVTVISLDGEYVAIVAFDAIGVLENRVRDLGDLLEEQGFARDRLVFTSSHAHTAPDTVGIWGIDEDLITGLYPPFMDSIVPGVYDAIEIAAGSMEPVTAQQGIAYMSADPTLNGEPFGGVNPDPSVVGGLNDIRDPIVPADAVWALALDGSSGRVATLVSASGHAETSGSDHSLLSADYPGYMRDYLERKYGGLAMFLPGSVGGMQSALGSTLPAIDDAGARIVDDAGDPTWITDDDSYGGAWEFARTWGTLVAQSAEGALADSTPWDQLSVTHADFLIPVNNISFKLAFQIGILDTPEEYVVQDDTCPGWGTDADLFGCVPGGAWMVRLGPSTLLTVPGELFPELFYGVPAEPAMADATLRSGDRRWVQWDPECATVDWAQCKASVDEIDGCDCLHDHVTPYEIADGGGTALTDLLPGTFKQPIGLANAYCGYIVPGPDFNTAVSVLTDDGDHYEETNSCSKDFAPLIQDAVLALTSGS